MLDYDKKFVLLLMNLNYFTSCKHPLNLYILYVWYNIIVFDKLS